QGPSGLVEGDELVAGLVLVGVATPRHGAESEAGDFQAGTSDGALLHGHTVASAPGLRVRGSPSQVGRVRVFTLKPLVFPPMWDLLKAVVLGTIQGLTEFLPISSSAHLRIFPELFGWGDP